MNNLNWANHALFRACARLQSSRQLVIWKLGQCLAVSFSWHKPVSQFNLIIRMKKGRVWNYYRLLCFDPNWVSRVRGTRLLCFSKVFRHCRAALCGELDKVTSTLPFPLNFSDSRRFYLNIHSWLCEWIIPLYVRGRECMTLKCFSRKLAVGHDLSAVGPRGFRPTAGYFIFSHTYHTCVVYTWYNV